MYQRQLQHLYMTRSRGVAMQGIALVVPVVGSAGTTRSDALVREVCGDMHSSLMQAFRHVKNFELQCKTLLQESTNQSADDSMMTSSASPLADDFNLIGEIASLDHMTANKLTKVFTKMRYLANETSQRLRKQISSLVGDINDKISSSGDSNGMLIGDGSSGSSSSSTSLPLIESIFDNCIQIERLWHLAEVTAFHDSIELNKQFIGWLQDDYDDISKLSVLEEFIQKYTASQSALSKNNLNRHVTSKEFDDDLNDNIGMRLDNTLAWLACRGHFQLLWKLFSIYPDVDHMMSSSSQQTTNNRFASAIDEFRRIIMSHACRFDDDHHHYENDNTNGTSFHFTAAELVSWKQQVHNFINANGALLGRLPCMYAVLQIFTGNDEVIVDCCRDVSSTDSTTWQCHILASLLYNYSPPLSRRDLVSLVDKSFLAVKSSRNVSFREEESHLTILDALEGNFAAILRRMYEIGMNATSLEVTTNRLFSCVNVTNLAYLLAIANYNAPPNRCTKDLLTPKATFVNEGSFMEELLLECGELFAYYVSFYEIMVGYLSLCPGTKGKLYMMTLIPRLHLDSDRKVLELSNLLRQYCLWDQAHDIENQRGMYWFKKSKLSHRIFDGNNTMSNVSAAKAMYFFQLAENKNKCEMILELCFVRCAYAVKRCSQLFPTLIIDPIKPSAPPMIPGASWCSDVVNVTQSTKVPFFDSLEMQSPMNQSLELLDALQDATDVLSALSHTCDINNPYARGLEMYVQAIRLQLDAPTWKDRVSAAKLIASLTLNGIMPMRHWLHLIELSAWFHSSLVTDDGDDDINDDVEVTKPISMFTKPQTYGLLEALLRVTNSFLSHRYANDATQENIQAIRETLLQALSVAVLQENAELGARHDIELQRKTMIDVRRLQASNRNGISESVYHSMDILGMNTASNDMLAAL